ncbi:MAG: phosphatase PAP2 family protein [Deltaproteobacteria bacterium]|nr:phosphatase PAP2 family protein [Deltaproteobacteria bacterium]
MFVNRNNSRFLDYLFRYGTDLGKGSIYAVLIIATLFIKYRYTLTVCLAAIVETILVQVPKKLIFTDVVRPIKHFDGFQNLHIVEHVKIHSHYSFPSGHTAVAFCVFTLLAIFIDKKYLEIPFFLLALFVGYSRIYLVQHFFPDVYFGAIIGASSALFSYWLIHIRPFPPKADWKWLDKRLARNR